MAEPREGAEALGSSCFAATAQPSAAISANGWYRVEDGDSGKAKDRLQPILEDYWLGQLAGVEKEVFIADIAEILLEERPGDSTIDAATTGAVLVPMPFFNQWKLKCFH